MVDVPHDGDHRRPREQVLVAVGLGVLPALDLLHRVGLARVDDLDAGTEVLGEQQDGVVGHRLGGGQHLPHLHEVADQIARWPAEPVGQVLHGDPAGHAQDALDRDVERGLAEGRRRRGLELLAPASALALLRARAAVPAEAAPATGTAAGTATGTSARARGRAATGTGATRATSEAGPSGPATGPAGSTSPAGGRTARATRSTGTAGSGSRPALTGGTGGTLTHARLTRTPAGLAGGTLAHARAPGSARLSGTLAHARLPGPGTWLPGPGTWLPGPGTRRQGPGTRRQGPGAGRQRPAVTAGRPRAGWEGTHPRGQRPALTGGRTRARGQGTHPRRQRPALTGGRTRARRQGTHPRRQRADAGRQGATLAGLARPGLPWLAGPALARWERAALRRLVRPGLRRRPGLALPGRRPPRGCLSRTATASDRRTQLVRDLRRHRRGMALDLHTHAGQLREQVLGRDPQLLGKFVDARVAQPVLTSS